MQQGGHHSVHNSRPAGEEVTGTRKKKKHIQFSQGMYRDIGVNEEKENGSEGAVQEPLIIFAWLQKGLDLCNGHANKRVVCVFRI